MNVLLSINSDSLEKMLIFKLIPKGINLKKQNNLKELLDAVSSENHFCLIDEGLHKENELFEVIENIKKDDQKKSCRIILLTKVSAIEILKEYVKKGIDTVIQRSLKDEEIIKKFMTFLENIEDQHTQRKYIRIKPSTNELIQVKIEFPQLKKAITGKVTDISMGGAAATFEKNDLVYFKENNIFSNAKILIAESMVDEEKKKAIITDLKLVKKSKEMAAFSFVNMKDYSKDFLANYIFAETQKLNEA